MTEVSIDFETYSEADLKSEGVYKYASHPSTEILCMAYSINGEHPKIWRCDQPTSLQPLFEVIRNGATVHAWNAQFERVLWNLICVPRMNWQPIKLSQWRCDQALASRYSFSLALEKCATMLRLPPEHQKDKEGTRLIGIFSVPKKGVRTLPTDNPADFDAFVAYCVQDVITQQAIVKAFPSSELQPISQKAWENTQVLCDYGIRLDMDLVNNAIKMSDTYTQELQDRINIATEGRLRSGKQTAKLKEELLAKGLHIENLQKATVESIDKSSLSPELLELVELREAAALSATSKYRKMQECNVNGRVHGAVQFQGASRTGRFAGRLIQPQNLPRECASDEVVECILEGNYDGLSNKSADLKGAIRPSIIPDDGEYFAIGDYSGIENRVLAWLADDEKALLAFERNDDQYVSMAAYIYGQSVNSLKLEKGTDEYSKKRMVGKVTVLGCGYGMSWQTFEEHANGTYKLGISSETAQNCVKAFREKYAASCSLWKRCEDAAKYAIKNTGVTASAGKIAYLHVGGHLYCKLPSGRNLCYPFATLKDNQITYASTFNTPETTWGGKLVENIDQAIAADILINALLEVERFGLKVPLHAHDEIVVSTPLDDLELLGVPEFSYSGIVNNAKQGTDTHPLQQLAYCMLTKAEWMKGIPLEVKGFYAKRYRK